MSVSRQAPRLNQKLRTRTALVQATAELLRAGRHPSVAEAADAARVSRATAYRYFPTREALHHEVAQIAPLVEPIEREVEGSAGQDPEARLLALLDTFGRVAGEQEPAMRSALRVYQDTWLEARRRGAPAPTVREGRRMRWLDEILAPLRRELPPARWRRLRSALALTVGMDARVVLKDVCHLEEAELQAVLRWTATTLLRGALAEGSKGRAARRGRRA